MGKVLLLLWDKNRCKPGCNAGGHHQRQGFSAPAIVNGMRKRRTTFGFGKIPKGDARLASIPFCDL